MNKNSNSFNISKNDLFLISTNLGLFLICFIVKGMVKNIFFIGWGEEIIFIYCFLMSKYSRRP